MPKKLSDGGANGEPPVLIKSFRCGTHFAFQRGCSSEWTVYYADVGRAMVRFCGKPARTLLFTCPACSLTNPVPGFTDRLDEFPRFTGVLPEFLEPGQYDEGMHAFACYTPSAEPCVIM